MSHATERRGNWCVILARGGSKGLPRKNMLPVAGRPCLAWTIEAAKACDRLDRIALSSDDAEMLEFAQASGIEVVCRDSELASDTARVDDAARDAVLQMEQGGEHARAIVVLYGNVPIRPQGCIDRAIAMLQSSNADSVQSYQPVGKYHPWWTARVDEGGVVQAWEGEVLNHGVFRRQDLPPALVPDGAVMALRREALFLQLSGVAKGPHAFFGRDRRGIVHPEGSVVDIDTRYDLLVADAMLLERRSAAA